jgi:hypothetical protein
VSVEKEGDCDNGPLTDEWLAEIDRRMDEMDRGEGKIYSWSEVRDEALARIRRDSSTEFRSEIWKYFTPDQGSNSDEPSN